MPGNLTEVASFNYNVKNDTVDIDSVVLTGEGFRNGDVDYAEVRFGDVNPSIDTVTTTASGVVVRFANLVTLPAKNYNVKVALNFSEGAVTGAVKKFTSVGVYNGTDVKGTGSISYGHYVAKAFPILAVKEKNTNSGNERLDLNVTKNTDAHKVVLNEINATANGSAVTFRKVSGSAGAFTGVELSKENAEVARSTTAKTAVQSVTFTVTDDYGHSVTYTGVDAANIADFAALAL